MLSAIQPAISLTAGQACDLGQAEPLLEEVDPQSLPGRQGLRRRCSHRSSQCAADHAGDLPKANRTKRRQTDFVLYRERNLIERFFNNLKQFRAIATRYDKLATTFLAVEFVAAFITLN